MCLKVCQTCLGLASQTSQGEKRRWPEMEKETGAVGGPRSKFPPTLLFWALLVYFDLMIFFVNFGYFSQLFTVSCYFGCCTQPEKSACAIKKNMYFVMFGFWEVKHQSFYLEQSKDNNRLDAGLFYSCTFNDLSNLNFTWLK